jgi:hypothetical protein
MNILDKIVQIFNSVDAMIDNMSLSHFSLVVDADLDALSISETLSTSETHF